MMSDLMGRYAVVTGGGKGIGMAIAARLLADAAAGVALIDYDEALVTRAAQELDPTGRRVIAVACDVSDADQVQAAVGQVLAVFGRVDILVNNAGITRDAMLHKMSRSDWDAVLDVNLSGPYHLCRALIPSMREQQYGRVVNIASTSAFGNVGQANYSASKAGLIGFTKTLAKEGASRGIVANCIAPGYIDTDMFQAIPQEVMKEYLKGIPMGRLGHPDEVAAVVSFLSGEDVSFLTGQCLIVSGGAQT